MRVSEIRDELEKIKESGYDELVRLRFDDFIMYSLFDDGIECVFEVEEVVLRVEELEELIEGSERECCSTNWYGARISEINEDGEVLEVVGYVPAYGGMVIQMGFLKVESVVLDLRI